MTYKQKEAQLLALLEVNEKSEIKNLEEFKKYLEKTQEKAKRKDDKYWIFFLLFCVGGVIVSYMYKDIGWSFFILLSEHIVILVFLSQSLRIETLLFYPCLIGNFMYFLWELKGFHLTRISLSQVSLKVFVSKIKLLFAGHQKAMFLICNVFLLLIRPSKINITQDYSFYFLHFLVLLIIIYKSLSILPLLYKIIVFSYTIYLSLLILHYEKITDYTMTDQTEKMITTIHIFYFSLLGLFLTTILFPWKFDKKKLFGLPLILLFFFIASQSQRSFLVFYYLIALQFFSKTNDFCMIFLLATSSYLCMHGSFGFDISLRAGNRTWGYNPDQFPIFTGFIFGVNKLGWFMVAGCGILASDQFFKVVEVLVLRGLAAIVVFLYVFYFYPAETLSTFMWCMSQCLCLIVSHSVGILFGTGEKKSEIIPHLLEDKV